MAETSRLPDMAPHSPLFAHEAQLAAFKSCDLTIKDLPLMSHISVRGDAGNSALVSAVKTATGLVFPQTPNTFTSEKERYLVWCAPDECLLIDRDASAASVHVKTLEAAFSGIHAAVVDVSHNRAGFEISKNAARELFSKFCTLDLYAATFQTGVCAQSSFARAPGLILKKADAPDVYWLFVRNSFAAYLADFMLDAAREFA